MPNCPHQGHDSERTELVQILLTIMIRMNLLESWDSPVWDEVDMEKFDQMWFFLEQELAGELLTDDEVMQLLSNIPSGSDFEDHARLLTGIIYASKGFPYASIWRAESFIEEVADLKLSAFDESRVVDKTNGCRFSFTDEVVTEVEQISRFLKYVDQFDRFDINNVLLLSFLAKNESMTYPDNYEKRLIGSIERSGYVSILEDGSGWYHSASDAFDYGLPLLGSYLEEKSRIADERVLNLFQHKNVV